MRQLAELLNEMRSVGVILDYALFGALAQMRYTAPVATISQRVKRSGSEPGPCSSCRFGMR